jgi:Na+/melibiose symporter-like transporter
VAAGLLIGLAFGPETPASSALLGRLATGRQRPLVFSVRQTGNQLGAMAGSLALPLTVVYAAPAYGFGFVVVAAVAAGVAFLVLRRHYDHLATGAGGVLDVRGSVVLVRRSPALRRLALASVPWSALQLALNAFLVTFAVERLALPHVTAGLLLATAQGGGLCGRLFWGAVATRVGASAVLAGLGFAMAAAAAAMALIGPSLPLAALFALAFAFGVTASGWNGVFLAEVARLAPEGRVGEATGAVLLASYTGLVVGPSLVSAVAWLHSLGGAYALLGALCALATIPLVFLSAPDQLPR